MPRKLLDRDEELQLQRNKNQIMYCPMSSLYEQLKFSLAGQLEDAIGCASELLRLKDGKVKCPSFNHFSGSVNPRDIYLPPAWMSHSKTFGGEA